MRLRGEGGGRSWRRQSGAADGSEGGGGGVGAVTHKEGRREKVHGEEGGNARKGKRVLGWGFRK